MYIIGFVYWYIGWYEAFVVPDKTAENVAHLLIDEIIPRFCTTLEIVTDNGTENVHQTVKHTLDTFKIKHITNSVVPPQSNSKVECFHRTCHDLHLNQVLADIGFNVNKSTKFSPYCLFIVSCSAVVVSKHGLYVGSLGSIPTPIITMTAAGGDARHVSLNH